MGQWPYRVKPSDSRTVGLRCRTLAPRTVGRTVAQLAPVAPSHLSGSACGGVLVEFEPMSPEEIRRTIEMLVTYRAKIDLELEKASAKTETLIQAVASLQRRVYGDDVQ